MLIRLKGLLRSLGGWLLVLVITLALLEVALRVLGWLPVQKNPLSGFFITHPAVGWVGEPGYRGRFRHPDFDVIVQHDDLGLRVADGPPPARDAGATRIAVLGDSFTWGWGVPAEARFTDLLQRDLGASAQVRNFGINAFSTAQELLMLEQVAAPFRPDIVLVMFFANDLEENHNEKEGRRPWFALEDGRLVPRNQPVTGEVAGWWRRLNRYSVALSTLRHGWHLLAQRLRSAPAAAAAGDGAVATGPTDGEWAVYQALMARMKDWCEAARPRCEVRVAVVPTRMDVAATGRGEEVPVTQRVLAICAALGIPALDLAPGLLAAWQSAPQPADDLTPLYFAHDGHWDLAGHAAVARVLRQAWPWQRPAAP